MTHAASSLTRKSAARAISHRLPGPTEWDGVEKRLAGLRLGRRGHGRLDESGGDGIHPNPPGTQLHRSDTGQHVHSGLRRAVGSHPLAHLPARDRRDVDDRAAAMIEHHAGLVLHGEEGSREADVQHGPPAINRVCVHGTEETDAGAVDRDIDSPVRVHRRTDQSLDVALLRDVDDSCRARAPLELRWLARSRSAALLSPMTTTAPSATNNRTVCQPMPDAPPVITATFPANRPLIASPVFSSDTRHACLPRPSPARVSSR